ncbi:hypothetical protein SAMN04487907_1282 [Zunongwangia mangrovi]|uniref:SH3 domain-containing protein n=1 Tax=Zunongwangia mangrovi TaxID=1334022 RepID=A0A1I1NE59_9FLAO|nr:hypothetical protein [Zunongwangia mangrovi]SFC95827.1 hypothetical protein SAMN04487907_1282 [Zunongwangia mangrovi]
MNLNDILKTQNFAQKINNQINPFDSITKILSSTNWTKQPDTLKMTEALLKGVSSYNNISSSAYEMTKRINTQPNFAIPNTTLDLLNSIGNQNSRLFEGINSALVLSKSLTTAIEIPNLQFALSGLSAQLAKIASSQQKWDILEDFDEITEEAVSINDRIIEEEGLSNENLEYLNEFLSRIEVKIDNQDKSSSAIFWKVLALISFILAITSEIRNWTPKPEFATQEEVDKTITRHFTNFEKKLKEQKEYRITNRKCKVFLKPKSKSKVVVNIEKGFEFVVLNINHKWIYVSYLNPNDNLPETGWIMKKYTERIK